MKPPAPAANLADTLDAYLRTPTGDALLSSPTAYVERGAKLVTPPALANLMALLPQVELKAAAIRESDRLRRRLDLLVRYFAETHPADVPARREVAFVLFYFLKGFDHIPDSVPEIGLLDDALLVETVLHRHRGLLQAHHELLGRTWPDSP